MSGERAARAGDKSVFVLYIFMRLLSVILYAGSYVAFIIRVLLTGSFQILWKAPEVYAC